MGREERDYSMTNLNKLIETLQMENWINNEKADIRTVHDLIDFCLELDDQDLEFLKDQIATAKTRKSGLV